MPDILIRDLPEHVVLAIDANAQRLGLSRNEYLRRTPATEARPVLVQLSRSPISSARPGSSPTSTIPR